MYWHQEDSRSKKSGGICPSASGPADAKAPERWEHFKNTVYNTALSTFGKNTKKMADWFEAHLEELMPAIEDKRTALAVYKACPSEYN